MLHSLYNYNYKFNHVEEPIIPEEYMIHFALIFKDGSISREYDDEDYADIDLYDDSVDGLVIIEGYEDADDADIYDAYICQCSSLKDYFN